MLFGVDRPGCYTVATATADFPECVPREASGLVDAIPEVRSHDVVVLAVASALGDGRPLGGGSPNSRRCGRLDQPGHSRRQLLDTRPLRSKNRILTLWCPSRQQNSH